MIKLDMQYFAEDGTDTNIGQDVDTQGTDTQTTNTVNYEDLFKTDKSLQSFVDKLNTKAIDTAIKNYEAKQQILADEKRTEAEKLQAMNEKEKQDYIAKKKDEEIAQLKQQIAVREMKEQVIKIGNDKKIPIELLNLIDYNNLKAEEVETTLDNLSTVFNSAVAKAVGTTLSGAGEPKGNANTSAVKTMTQDEFSKLSMFALQKLRETNKDLYELGMDKKL